jgi:hypothetical protein
MKTRLGLTLLVASLAGACTEEPADGGSKGSGAGKGSGTSGGGGAASNVLDDSPFIAEAELERMVTYLASDELAGRRPGTPGGLAARAFIVKELERCGIAPLAAGSYEQPVAAMDGSANVLGVVRGSDPRRQERHVILSAHYDHLGQQGPSIYRGADDNAAGVAIALGIGCAIAASPAPRSVVIAAWDAEEPPTFLTPRMGSQHYAQNPVVPLEQTDVVVALDLVGSDIWPGYGGHFYLGSELSAGVASALETVAVPYGLLLLRGGLHLAEEQPLGLGRQPWSDYDAFRNLAKPVLFVSNGQNKRYHTPADTVDALSLPKMALEAKALLRVVTTLASAESDPIFDAAGADYATDAVTVKTVLGAALAPGGLVDALGLSAASRAKLETDLADATAIAAKLAAPGATASEQEIRRLRDGTQRVMCLAGSMYEERVCSVF